MFFRKRIPELSPQQVADKLNEESDFVLMDVREQDEFDIARINDSRIQLVPLSQLAEKGAEALPEKLKNPAQEIVVFCHLGSRSSQVVNWLQQNGWSNVWNMSGGIDAFSRMVNPEIRRY